MPRISGDNHSKVWLPNVSELDALLGTEEQPSPTEKTEILARDYQPGVGVGFLRKANPYILPGISCVAAYTFSNLPGPIWFLSCIAGAKFVQISLQAAVCKKTPEYMAKIVDKTSKTNIRAVNAVLAYLNAGDLPLRVKIVAHQETRGKNPWDMWYDADKHQIKLSQGIHSELISDALFFMWSAASQRASLCHFNQTGKVAHVSSRREAKQYLREEISSMAFALERVHYKTFGYPALFDIIRQPDYDRLFTFGVICGKRRLLEGSASLRSVPLQG
jgi:hypothetical protein